MGTLDLYVPEKLAGKIADAVMLSASASKPGAGARERFAKVASVRSIIRRVVNRIRDPKFAENLEFMVSRKNALLKGLSPRLVEPEIIEIMTELGIAKEVLLRSFTGAAAPETEYTRFGTVFVGAMTDGPEALSTQLRTLDTALREQQELIIEAGRDALIVGPPIPDDFVHVESDAVTEALLKALLEPDDEEGAP
jgi:ATPase subunit of ABC transporter with duplicated ATPase domains